MCSSDLPGVVRTKIGVSERNRPGGVKGDAFGEEGLITATEAIEPEAVAQAVLRAINDGTFWIMTHPRYVDLVKTRAEGMLTGAMPPIPHPI